ncbi:hypothetical protein PF005_g17412 [Phytophthora fragariae]|uniref:Uncharacterized protein n=1 Tax=Phytophthora fragariae TaxID=53985 RepID=A0A6A3Y5P7_9STRA|nr:hypothetical protein PF003_g2922 [Phytophthora fragariae]KAE8931128.1 hypothetical protein PF009_g18804 [Phytophthora fragariae]KAE8994833.1 hypothetical protein PF011_g16581 [Phytophthora fragariae]KAE9094640.1 hypothetical protein PF010_g17018 [Phytophthora fragariae]KAE9095950.1 hypothetical protein PF007_g17195 [Phytophthora fragariae]
MTPGVLGLLTVVPAKTLRKKGIPFVMKKLYGLIGKPVETEHKAKWDAFWEYFVSTWCELYELSCWNTSGMIEANVEIVNRTNNPLETYNRKLADTFGTSHMGLLNFVQVLKDEAKYYL